MQRGGGIIIAGCLMGGAIIGVMLREGSLGIVIGFVVGVIAASIMAWRDSRRKP